VVAVVADVNVNVGIGRAPIAGLRAAQPPTSLEIKRLAILAVICARGESNVAQ